MPNIRKIFDNGKKIALPILNGQSVKYLYYNGICIWKNDDIDKVTMVMEFRTGYTSITIPVLETNYAHAGKIKVTQKNDYALYDYNTNEQFIITNLNSSYPTTVEFDMDNISEISNNAFYNCYPIYKLEIKDTMLDLNTIGNHAFHWTSTQYDSSLDTITLSNCVKSLGDYCFYGNGGLNHFGFPVGLETIGNYCFAYTNILYSVYLPSIKTIGNYAFQSCDYIQSISIGSSIQSIGEFAFVGTKNVGVITVAENSYYKTVNNVLFNKTGTILFYYAPKHSATTYTIPEGVTVVYGSAFLWNTRLTEIFIASTITEIQDNAFSECSELTNIVIPDTATMIGNGLFSDCGKLNSVTLNTVIDEIKSSMFNNCTSLTTINIPNNITVIGSHAFSNSGLISVTIPHGITEIGSYAFASCSSLTTIYYSGTEDEWNSITKGSYWNNKTYAEIICLG